VANRAAKRKSMAEDAPVHQGLWCEGHGELAPKRFTGPDLYMDRAALFMESENGEGL
jgi:hypothetical protein